MIAATLFAKTLGLFRSMILAWTLGDSLEAVAFAAASKIPGAVFDLLFSAAILGCFIPEYNKARARSEGRAREYSCAFFGAALAASALFAAAGVLLAPQIIAVTAPKISAEAAVLSARLLRIMFPAMVFTAGAYTLTGLMQSHGNFILPAAVSAVSNVFIIGYLLISGGGFSVYALAAVYTLSWLLQFLTLALPLAAKKRLPRPRIAPKNESLRASLRSAPQIMAGSWLAPASVLTAAFFSSFVSDETFVMYDYASGIYTIISGIAVYGVGNYVFPELSKVYARGEGEGFAKEVSRAVLSIMLIILPVGAAAYALAEEGITLLYVRGNFTAELAHTCAGSLRILSAAMPACALSEILYRAFYAAGKAKIPMYATLCAIGTSAAANALSLALGAGLAGISAAFAAAQWVHALFLLAASRRFFPGLFARGGVRRGLALLPGGALCFGAMLLLQRKLPLFSQLHASIAIFLKITIVFAMGIVIYLLYIYITGVFRPCAKKEKRGENK